MVLHDRLGLDEREHAVAATKSEETYDEKREEEL